MSLINVKVVKIIEEAEGIRSLSLKKTGFFKLPNYKAGAHIDVHCGEGIIRQYSLCGDPNDRRHFLIAVKQVEASRGGSDLMHLSVEEGDWLEIGSPRNNFHLDESASHFVLLAAGIGITPIIAMADRLYDLGKPFELHYFSRSAEHTAFQSRLKAADYAKQVSFHQGLNVSQTSKQLETILAAHKEGSQLYMCGPLLFMDAAQSVAYETWPEGSVRLEHFASKPTLESSQTHPFIVELAKSEVTLEIAENETILDALERNDIDAAFSCEQGVCGTCVTEVIEGTPEHRDSFLSNRQKQDGNRMCICVSRAKNEKLVLDL